MSFPVEWNRKRAGCADCPVVHHAENLKKLGVDPGNADYIIALAGNPNTGKSTIFNALTGLRQHTGNWTGKTVSRSEGSYSYHGKKYKVVDLPGTYSLISSSAEEEIARNFILFARPDVTLVIADATRLERNLNLALQILEITSRTIVCVNLIDEAERAGIKIDKKRLSADLGVPVVFTVARDNKGLHELLSVIEQVAQAPDPVSPRHIHRIPGSIHPAINKLSSKIREVYPEIPNTEWLALRLLDRDQNLELALLSGELENLYTPSPSGNLTGPKHEKKEIESILSVAARLRNEIKEDFHDRLTEGLFREAHMITEQCVTSVKKKRSFNLDLFLDRIFMSPLLGYPVMFLLFALMFWITITGANYPSAMLYDVLIGKFYPLLKEFTVNTLQFPWWLSGILVDGIYLATAWVVSVMLPPMAIFFPMFTLLEDFGYLPRVAFNLDNLFKKAGAHGKQVMSMMMGFGCNAAGVIATRIIDSPRERLIAIITNNFAICNGRWPTQILIATIFIGSLVPAHIAGVVSAMAVVGVALFGILLTFIVSWGLSRTVLKGKPSIFSLELPPYRMPKILRVIYTSMIDRTIFVLWRAVIFAVPAGAVIWLIANVQIQGETIAAYMIGFLDPPGWILGLNGVILVAYLVAIPANEIVIPTILMLIVLMTGMQEYAPGSGVLFELESTESIEKLLRSGGWTLLTAVNLMLFSLIHNPCSTTIFTIYKETKSLKWTAVSTFLPLVMGLLLTTIVALVWRIIT